jgi:hypothetical protein
MNSRPGRLRFERVSESGGGVEVTLGLGGRSYSGRSSAADPSSERPDLLRAATATLGAIEECVAGEFICDLQEVDRVRALGKDRVVMLVTIEFEGRRIQLFGSCVVEDDALVAAARAALDATNRHVDIVLARQGR